MVMFQRQRRVNRRWVATDVPAGACGGYAYVPFVSQYANASASEQASQRSRRRSVEESHRQGEQEVIESIVHHTANPWPTALREERQKY